MPQYDASIVQRELIFTKDNIYVKLVLNKNFNRLSEFIRVDRENRQFELNDVGTMIDRNILIEDFIELNEDNTLSEGVPHVTEVGIDEFHKVITDRFGDFVPTDIGTQNLQNTIVSSDKAATSVYVSSSPLLAENAVGCHVSFDDVAHAGFGLTNVGNIIDRRPCYT